MPAHLPGQGLGCKLVSLFPRNVDRHTHQAVILVFDPEHGTPVALGQMTRPALRIGAGMTRRVRRVPARRAAVAVRAGAPTILAPPAALLSRRGYRLVEGESPAEVP